LTIYNRVAVQMSLKQRRADASPVDLEVALEAIQNRVLWLAVRMVHEANAVRTHPDGLKVGGHQASSASVVSILTALYLRWLRPGDLVSVKPHASPVYHALQYLLGNLDARDLTQLRAFGGLQAYPSETKDPDLVDFSTGSVGLGAVAPLFAAFADRYARAHFANLRHEERRFVALVGDAELDEGNVWEAAIDDNLRKLGNVTIIVDLNRQSLDRVIPGIKARELETMFSAAGWRVLEAKYGRRLEQLFARRGGELVRRRLDEMPNGEYQHLIRYSDAEARDRFVAGASPGDRDAIATCLGTVPAGLAPAVLADLGGHDVLGLERLLGTIGVGDPSPSIVFAYTIKGWRLPFAGDSLNHSASLSSSQISELAGVLGADEPLPWQGFPANTPAGRLLAARRDDLYPQSQAAASTSALRLPVDGLANVRIGRASSSQQAFGDALVECARIDSIGKRIVTASPDVSVSTSLGGWINRVGVFAAQVEEPKRDGPDGPQLLRWEPNSRGQHIEFGISEMNLFMWLSQAGHLSTRYNEPIVPIGTVYDPFICRGLDALIYGLYSGARFIVVGTPSGITLSPEGGAHQSTVTPSLGIELPGLRAYEPTFGREAVWCLHEAIDGVLSGSDGFCTYLRLSTRIVDQDLAATIEARLGLPEWRRQTLAGGYQLLGPEDAELPVGAPQVTIAASGALVPEAIAAVRELHREEVAARLLVVTSAERLSAELHDRRLRSIRDRQPDELGHLGALFGPGLRRSPIVTVADGASHGLSFLGGVYGAPVVPLGVDTFGQSGTIADLYGYTGIDQRHIVEAALLALDL
jgi:pyruvate dehydrogenase E1 component